MDDKIAMNPPRDIGIPLPQVTRTRMINCNIFNSVSRVFLWNNKMKNETGNLVENLDTTQLKKILSAKII